MEDKEFSTALPRYGRLGLSGGYRGGKGGRKTDLSSDMFKKKKKPLTLSNKINDCF